MPHPLPVRAFVAGAVALLSLSAAAQQTPPAAGEEPPPTFDAAYMADAKNIDAGKVVWEQQCRHCHGNAAYPGKAPKLSPGGYTPDFIFDRVTYGFRKMPAWREVFTREQRKAVAAYIKSDRFAP